MVLHNNKWDRRAKHKYLKKHGLSAGEASRGKEHATLQDEAAEAAPAEHTDTSEDEQNNGADGIVVAPELPDSEELDPKLRKLFLERGLTGTHQRPIEKTHTVGVADASEIQQATAGVERSKLNKAVRERFGSSVAAKLRKNPVELESDSDFDDFMDKLDDDGGAGDASGLESQENGSSKVNINVEKQEFLDRLFR